MPSRFLVEREEKSNIPQSKIRDFRQRLRASGRGSDSIQGCHSLPRLRFAYPLGKGARLWGRQSRPVIYIMGYVRPKEWSLRAAKAAWQSVPLAAIRRRGALHRRKTDSHDQFANWSRNDKGRKPVPFLVEREEKSDIPQSKIRDFRQRLRASGRGADSQPGCRGW